MRRSISVYITLQMGIIVIVNLDILALAKFSNLVCLQWGSGTLTSISATNAKTITVNLPTSFSEYNRIVVGSTSGQGVFFYANSYTVNSFTAGVRNITSSSIASADYRYVAIGY